MEKNTSNIEKINNDLNNMLGSFIQRGLGKNKTYIIKKDASNVITNSTFINKEFSYKKLLILMVASISNHLFTKLILGKPKEINIQDKTDSKDFLKDYRVTISKSELSMMESKNKSSHDHYTYHYNDSILTKNKLHLEKKNYAPFYTKLSQVILDISQNKVKVTKEI